MITESLINYIKNQQSKSVPNELIISKLIQVGWRMDDIEEAIAKTNPLILNDKEVEVSILSKEEPKKDYKVDPYHEPTQSLQEIPSFIKIRGFKKEEFVKEEPVVEVKLQKEESSKIWTPTAIKAIDEIKIESEKSVIKPVSTRNLEAFQLELNQPNDPINKNLVNNIKKETEVSPVNQDNEIIPTFKPKISIEQPQELSLKSAIDQQSQPGRDVGNLKIESTVNPIEVSGDSSLSAQKKIVENTKDVSKIAMISSYSEDYMSANKLKQEVYKRRKNTLLKSLLVILIICIIGGIVFSVKKGYIKIPDFNFSFIKKDSNSILVESALKFNSLKSYKVETEAKVSFPSFDDITSGLLTGEVTNSKNEDHFTLLSKGEITKMESNSEFNDYTITLKSSILDKDIKMNIKNDGVRSFVDIPDLSTVFKGSPSLEGVVSLPSNQLKDMVIILPDSIKDKDSNKDLLGIIFNNYLKNDFNQSSFSFKSVFDDIELIKKSEENINGVKINQYTVDVDKVILKDFLSKASFALLGNLTEEEKSNFDKIWSSVSVNSLEVWIGEKDNNLYKYKFSLIIPLSKVIGLEDKSISKKEVVLDWQTTFYDLDVPNNVVVPISKSMNFDDFSNKISDLKLKNVVSSLVLLTGEMKNSLGNYGLKSNTVGSCTNPVSGSLFSPLGHNKNASSVVGKIASVMSTIVGQTAENSRCFSNSKTWAISVPLPSDSTTYFCLDSAGNSLDIKEQITKTTCK